MLWYEPILDRAWDSVENINNVIPYGFHLRNIHYHASNAMVMLALYFICIISILVADIKLEMKFYG